MPTLNSQVVGNAYPTGSAGAILQGVWNAKGGWFSVSGAGAYVKLQYGSLGADHWVDEILLGAGAFVILPPNCIGVQFRNSVANAIATVTAQIAQGDEPPLAISSYGQTNVVSTASLNFQRNDLAVATEPTLDFMDAAGVITWAVVDDVPGTRVRVTPAFTSPALFPGAVGIGGNAGDTPLSRVAAGVVGSTMFSTGPTSEAVGGGGTAGLVMGTRYNAANASATGLAVVTAVTTDTQARFAIDVSGTHTWGPGGATARDLTFQRTNVSRCQFGTTGQTARLDVQSQATADVIFSTFVQGDSQPRVAILGSGQMNWGTGALAADTNWLRLAAGVIGSNNAAVSNGPTTNGRLVTGCFLDTAGRLLATAGSATNATLASAVLNDTGWRISGDLNLTVQTGTNQAGFVFGTGTGGGDLQVARSTNNPTTVHLDVNRSISLTPGSVYAGLTSVSPTPTTSVTPNYATESAYIIGIGGTGGGTLTINNPSNPPAASQTGWLYIQINNPPGNTTTTLAWGGAFSGLPVGGLPASVLQAGFWRLWFVWSGASWLLIIKLNA